MYEVSFFSSRLFVVTKLSGKRYAPQRRSHRDSWWIAPRARCAARAEYAPVGAGVIAIIPTTRAVLTEARRTDSRVGQCRLVAFLLRRPPGVTSDRRDHTGSFGFVAFEVDVLLGWDPRGEAAPATVTMSGDLLQRRVVAEPSSLPPAPRSVGPPPRDRLARTTYRACALGAGGLLLLTSVSPLAWRGPARGMPQRVC